MAESYVQLKFKSHKKLADWPYLERMKVSRLGVESLDQSYGYKGTNPGYPYSEATVP